MICCFELMNPAGSMNGFCCRKEGRKEDDVPWDAEESSCLHKCFLLLQAGRKGRNQSEVGMMMDHEISGFNNCTPS